MSNRTNGWISKGQGLRPSLRWSFRTDAPLVDVVLAREAGDVILADESDALYRLDRCGDVASVNRGIGEVRAVTWADTGAWGYLLQGENELTRVNRQLEAEWVVELPEPAMGLSCTPYGHHVAVGLVDGKNRIYDSEAKLVCEYETARPLSFLAFLTSDPARRSCGRTWAGWPFRGMGRRFCWPVSCTGFKRSMGAGKAARRLSWRERPIGRQ